MKFQVVSVYDLKAEMWSRPYFVHSLGMAIRSFGDECKRTAEDNPFSKHPEDYALYSIGVFDDDNGKIEGVEKRLLVRGTECVTNS